MAFEIHATVQGWYQAFMLFMLFILLTTQWSLFADPPKTVKQPKERDLFVTEPSYACLFVQLCSFGLEFVFGAGGRWDVYGRRIGSINCDMIGFSEW